MREVHVKKISLNTAARQLDSMVPVRRVPPRTGLTVKLVAGVIWVLLTLCGPPPLRHAVGGQSLAVWRRGVATLGVETDTPRAPRELPGASELSSVRSIHDLGSEIRSPSVRDIDDKLSWLQRHCPCSRSCGPQCKVIVRVHGLC